MKCRVCGASDVALKRCCDVLYCSRACQAADRKAHAAVCKATTAQKKKTQEEEQKKQASRPNKHESRLAEDYAELDKVSSAMGRLWGWPVARTSKVRVAEDKELGKILVAATSIVAGEEVLSESPVFLYVKYGTLNETARSILHAFSRLDSALQRHILGFFFCPESNAPGSEAAMKVYREAVASQNLLRHEDALKILLITHVNSHMWFGFYNTSKLSFAALFETSSKVEHSCQPNAMFSTFSSGLLKHTALSPLAPGDRVSVSYSTTIDMTLSLRRSALLSGKCFVCRCVLCVAAEKDGEAIGARQCPHCDGGIWEGRLCCETCKKNFDEREVALLPPHRWMHHSVCRRLLQEGEKNPFRGIESVVWREQTAAFFSASPRPFSLEAEERARDDKAAAAKLRAAFAGQDSFFGGAQEALFCGRDLHRVGMAESARVVLKRYMRHVVAFLGEENADVKAIKLLVL